MSALMSPLLPDVETLERRFRRAFAGFPLLPDFTTATPAADVYETPKEFVVELEVPGYAEKDLSVEIGDHTLAVEGVREEAREEAEKSYRLQERLEKTFKRTFALPTEVDTEHVKAEFEKGVLKVHVPKNELHEPRKIAISKS
jgi:HSP20 family protein